MFDGGWGRCLFGLSTDDVSGRKWDFEAMEVRFIEVVILIAVPVPVHLLFRPIIMLESEVTGVATGKCLATTTHG